MVLRFWGVNPKPVVFLRYFLYTLCMLLFFVSAFFFQSDCLERPHLVCNQNSCSMLYRYVLLLRDVQIRKTSEFSKPHIFFLFLFWTLCFFWILLRFVRIALWLFLLWSLCFPGENLQIFFGTVCLIEVDWRLYFFFFACSGKSIFSKWWKAKLLYTWAPQRTCWVP